jgi:membrane-bound lytic murein transglycosylase F
LKAQYWQESRLTPDARSPAGAEGIAQFMAPTWSDAIKALGWPQLISRRDAAYAIEGGAWYMGKLRRSWKNRTARDSHDLALASYNAGIGNILRAQGRCGGAKLWQDIAPCLSDITGSTYARETTDYVMKIDRWHADMEPDWRR